MRSPILSRPLRAGAALALIVAVVAALAIAPRPLAAQSPEDGCDSSEPIACIPLPEDEPRTAAPSIAAPQPPPISCPPLLGVGAQIAAPQPPRPGCDRRAVVATVNRANVLYARALRTLDTSELREVWADGALQVIVDYVGYLRATGHYATPELRSISLEELNVAGGRATVRTLEHWLYQERSRFTGRVIYQENQWVANLYELEWRGRWVVVYNETAVVPAPLPRPVPVPVPPAPITPPGPPCIAIFPPPPGCGPSLPPVTYVNLETDSRYYRPGDLIAATMTNIGTLEVVGGGGYRCGMIDLEIRTPSGWSRAPGAAEVCTAIGIVLRPGETRTETFVAPRIPGEYRLVARVSSEWQTDNFYSGEFFVR